MKIQPVNISNSLNKAYRKSSLKRDDIESFKKGFKRLFHRINEKESEENLKNIVADFFKECWYKHTDISALEAEIDRLVYELYGLTEEEIQIEEGR